MAKALEVTGILHQIQAGDDAAAEKLMPLVYNELRRLAAAKLAHERPGQTLQATALVHEAWLRLTRGNHQEGDKPESETGGQQAATVPQSAQSTECWNSRGHFFGAAAEAMRRILVENARRKGRLKRGGNLKRRNLEVIEPGSDGKSADVLAVDEALTALEQEHPRKAELVKLRYFAGLTQAEAAAALGISTATADRHWRYARAWLAKRLREA